ncbi:uncharacterized protein Bfra_001644 [Botrytis fragariae]|uniref:Uncharacterized protein n=1 Tax=Botrytis fragariae TaxID=1964551 RepID=A0A8H6EM24_9HELO|nr:uncharacterized protein Bfra_001644 [Botrytis fragariae]KAF5877276.1 hypothetical protein Bfra_001644 [Botrytis fragariae]
MHLTKPALVVASFLWATTFASPIDSSAILRTRGLIGGSTTDDSTKNTAGSTTANNAVGNDNTKNASESNAVEDAVGSLNLEDITGGLSARDVEGLHRGHKSQEGEIIDDALNIADDATPGGFIDRTTRRGVVGDDAGGLTARNVLRRHHGHKNEGNGVLDGAADIANEATGGGDTDDAAGGIIGGVERRDDISDQPPHADIASLIFLNTPKSGTDSSTTDTMKRFVVRDNDGAVHDANQAVHEANQAVHDANKAVHQANEVVHNTLHGLLHGILR